MLFQNNILETMLFLLFGKVKKWTDESNARTGFLELCPDWKDYPEGYAIGMGKTYDVPDTRPVKLMGTKLFKYINCEKVYKQIGIPVDEQAQVWIHFCCIFKQINSFRVFWDQILSSEVT